jgi:phosphosulfolactate synthase
LTPTAPEWIKRVPKPRDVRRTQVLDKGLGRRQIDDMIEVAGHLIDLVKLGWGTALVTGGLDQKVGIYRDAGIDLCLGGTLLELYYRRGELEQYEEFVRQLGLTHVEVSDGTIELPIDEKIELIARFASDFTVYSEVGQKDPDVVVTPAKWVRAIQAELDAGASKVILEGRESGTAGMYRTSGEIRMGLIDEILDAGIPPEKLIFEAPNKASQTWFIRHIGVDVNLANVPPEDVIPLETLRLGLRADTLLDIHGG